MMFAKVAIFSLLLGAATCADAASPANTPESDNTARTGFSQLHNEDSNQVVKTFTQNDVSSFFANLRQELDKPENLTHRHRIFLQGMETYLEHVRGYSVQTHFQCVEYMIKVFKLNAMADVYGMVSTPFFKLAQIPLDEKNVTRLVLESGLMMSEFNGGLMNNPQANASAGLHAMLFVQEQAGTPENMKSVLATGWAKSYHSASWVQSLQAVKEALQAAIALCDK